MQELLCADFEGHDHAAMATERGTHAMLHFRNTFGGNDHEMKATSACLDVFPKLPK